MKMVYQALLLLALAGTAAPAQSAAALTPDEIYFKAVDRLHSLPEPPFIDFHVRAGGSFVKWSGATTSHGITRTRDRMQFLQEMRENDRDPADAKKPEIRKNDLSPDLFIQMQREADRKEPNHESPFGLAPMVLATPAPDDRPGLIGSVRVLYNRFYRVTLSGLERLDGCSPQAYHLKLQPRGNSEQSVLRDLWISTDTFDICRLRAATMLNEGPVHAPASVEVTFGQVGRYWLATGISGGARSRFLLLSASVNFDVAFTGITTPENEPDWLFDKKLYFENTGKPAAGNP